MTPPPRLPDPPPPPGVTLRDPEDSDALRGDIEQGIKGAFGKYVHGFAYGGVRLELADVDYADKPTYSLAEQKEALMSDKTLSRRLRGTVRLVDEETNKVLDQRKNMTLARVPYMTQRGTFIHNGTEYAAGIAQSRLLPGAYARKRDNGETEVHINTRAGTGSAMRVVLDPTSAQFRLKIGTSDLHAYSVFKDLGVSDEELARRWGPEMLEANKTGYSAQAIERAYTKAVPKWERDEKLPIEDKVVAIRASLDRAQVAESVLRRTLPNLFSREKAASWRISAAAHDLASGLDKSASFNVKLSPEEMYSRWYALDYSTIDMIKSASTDRRLSILQPPPHWQQGWMDWYEGWYAGVKSASDDHYLDQRNEFLRKSAADFVEHPTAAKAREFETWGVDPTDYLPQEKRAMLALDRKSFAEREHAAWLARTAEYEPQDVARLVKTAADRGMTIETGDEGDIMIAALEGYLKPEDFQ